MIGLLGMPFKPSARMPPRQFASRLHHVPEVLVEANDDLDCVLLLLLLRQHLSKRL